MLSRIRGSLARARSLRFHLRYGLSRVDAAMLAQKGLELADLEENGLFDPTCYRSSYPELDLAKSELLLHFATVGWREGRNPSALFDTVFYLESNGDVLAAGLNPLVHYFCAGSAEGRSPHAVLGSERSTTRPDLVSVYSGEVPKLWVRPAGFSRGQSIHEMLDYSEQIVKKKAWSDSDDR